MIGPKQALKAQVSDGRSGLCTRDPHSSLSLFHSAPMASWEIPHYQLRGEKKTQGWCEVILHNVHEQYAV